MPHFARRLKACSFWISWIGRFFGDGEKAAQRHALERGQAGVIRQGESMPEHQRVAYRQARFAVAPNAAPLVFRAHYAARQRLGLVRLAQEEPDGWRR
jgi:hypothetical protein